MKTLAPIVLISISLVLTACAGNIKNDSLNDQHNQTDANTSKDKPLYSDFDQEKDTLYDLLVAEIAAQRSEFTIALVNYLQQAHITRDVEVVKRAINAAQYLKDMEAVTEMASLWLDIEPDSVPAHQLLAFQHSLEQNYDIALSHIDKIIELHGEARVDSLAITASTLPEDDRKELLRLYQDLSDKYPDNSEVSYSVALVQKSLKLYDESLATINPILQKFPDFEAPSVLKADILYSQGKLDEALSYAEDKFEDFPQNHNLGRLYATMLIEAKRLDDAEAVFQSLVEQYPQASRLKLSLGIVMFENKKTAEAKEVFTTLISEKRLVSPSHFYLARLADIQQNPELAIHHYNQVTPGPHFEFSLERSNYLMAKAGQVDEVISRLEAIRKKYPQDALKYWLMQVKLFSNIDNEEQVNKALDAAILEFPNDEQLLYARAMNRESKGNLAGMEEDLRTIIENNEENAIALNALGYTLADRTDRTEEAFLLIQKALTLRPENPAILDSMGWVLFKLGKKEEALVFLLKAFQKFQDGEIAAHLGEVLLSLNQLTEAREVWGNLLIKQPEHKVLNETVERLDPEFYQEFKTSYEKALKERRDQSQADQEQQQEQNSGTPSEESNIEQADIAIENSTTE